MAMIPSDSELESATTCIYKRHVCPGSNTDAKAEAALSLGGWFSSPLPPLTFLILFAKVLILIWAFINVEPKLEDACSVVHAFGKSINLNKGIHEF